MTETSANKRAVNEPAVNKTAVNDATFEVVWEVSQTTRYRATWTTAEIAGQLGIPATEDVTTVLDNDQFWDLLTDVEDDQHRDDRPDTIDRTVISVRQTTRQQTPDAGATFGDEATSGDDTTGSSDQRLSDRRPDDRST